MAVDGSDNVIVTGQSMDSGGTPYYASIKYSGAGVPLWTNRYNGPGNGSDVANVVVVDHSGNVIVAGGSYGSGNNSDFATIKYVFPLVATYCDLTNGMFQVQVDNLKTGTLVIEASTNLAGWLPIFTNTTPTNVLFYTDPDAGNHSGRFYRAFQFP